MTMTLSLLVLSLVTSTRSIAETSHELILSTPQATQVAENRPMAVIAQATPATPVPPITGTQALLNGQSVRVPWIQWQTPQGTRIGVADGALRQFTGARYFSTDATGVQPIDWFLPVGTPESSAPRLAAQVIGNDRYLDVTDWATSLGWQVQVQANQQANQMVITTPAAQVRQLVQQSSPEFDRVVIQLDRPTTYQVDAQGKEWVLTLDAIAAPEVVKQFQPQPSRRLAALKLEADAAKPKTTLRLGIPITSRPVITTQSNPAQITIDVGIPDRRDHSILWKPGMQWRQQVMTIGNTPLTVLSFELDPRSVKLRPVIPSSTPDLAGIATVLNTAQQSQSLLSMNGGFFNRTNQLPLGMIQTDGVLRSGPILNRGVMAWDDAGNFRFDRYSLQEMVTIGSQTLALNHLNSAYVQAGISRYTSGWGSSYKTLSDSEVVFTVVGNVITDQKTMAAAGSETVAIPAGGYLLVIRSNRTLAATIPTGSPVQLRASESVAGISAFPQVLGGGPLLIQNRQIVLNAEGEKFSPAFAKERAARSAIGRLASGKLLMVAVHNSIGGPGASLGDMAQIMQYLGATDALNFDGGSSTTLYLGGSGGQVIDRPSRSSARVHSAIGVFSK
jgi:Phosphodiester glycosidase